MFYAILPQRALFAVSGEDAESFLQGLVTNDVARLNPGAAMYAALLSPQGRFLHDFFLMRRGAAMILDAARDRLPDLLARMTLYKLRSKVKIERLPESEGVVAAWGEQELGIWNLESGILAFVDPRLPQLGWRLVGNVQEIAERCQEIGWKKSSPEKYDRFRLELGVPDGALDLIPEKSLLLEFGFEQLHGVSFTKGCYVGQEVTARSKHRAQLRKSLYRVKSPGAELPPPGTPVMAGGADIGQLRSHSGDIGLAVLRVEEVEKGGALQAGGVPITASLPEWMG